MRDCELRDMLHVSRFTSRITCDSRPVQLKLELGGRREAIRLANIDGWEKDTDARRWRRCIDDPRRDINSFPVAIRPINTLVVAISMPSLLVTATIISADGRHHVYTADHGG